MRSTFGPLGIAIPAVLLSEAEAQKQMGGRRGVVKLSYGDLAYFTGSDPETARKAVVAWIDVGEMVDATIGEHAFEARWKDWDLWQEPRSDPAADAAREFLRDVLGDGRTRPVQEVNDLAVQAGITKRTLERARKDLGVKASGGPNSVLSLDTANSAITATY
jgi:hypothetical protein